MLPRRPGCSQVSAAPRLVGASDITGHQITFLLADIALIALLARLFGVIARWLKQPAVLGEILAGIIIGPSFFGGSIARELLPPDVRPGLGALATIGIVFFMFCTGLELDQPLLRRRSRALTAVSIGSIGLPLVLGATLSLYLAQHYAASQHHLTFVLFMAAAMSVTALPVLARILADRRMGSTELGQAALACAAVTDVVAWILLGVAIAVSRGGGHSLWRMLAVGPYILVMLGQVRPALRRLTDDRMRHADHPSLAIGLVIATVIASAVAANWMGLGPILGAFFVGAVLPHTTRVAVQPLIAGRAGKLSRAILLPVFFVTAGLQVDLTGFGGRAATDLLLILIVAIVSKFAGTFVAARWTDMTSRDAAGLGALLNARGLTELVVLSIGLQVGALNRSVYSLMVVMAVITTAMAGPLLDVIYPTREPRPDTDEAAPAEANRVASPAGAQADGLG